MGAPAPLDETWSTSFLRVLPWMLLTRIMIVGLGLASSWVVEPGPHFRGATTFLELFANWDTGWYLNIANEGYHFAPDRSSSVAFFPLYPMLVAALGELMPTLVAGYLVSNLAFLVALTLLRRLVLLDYEDAKLADRVVWFVLISPVTLFFSLIYTESLFFCLLLATLYAARQRRWWLVGILGALLSGTRALGVLVVVPVALEYSDCLRGGLLASLRRIRWDAAYLTAIPLGLVAYMTYLHFAFGNAFAFQVASAHWGRKFVFFLETVIRVGRYEPYFMTWFVSSLLSVVLLLWVAATRRLRMSYLTYAYVLLFFNLSSRLMESTPRYFAVLFPIYFGAAFLAHEDERIGSLLQFGSAIAMAITTILYVNGYWIV